MIRVIVIAGWGRSGSTILANVLGSAPGVVTLGEINNIWDRGFGSDLLCSCGEPFSACQMWRPIAERAFGADRTAVAERARETSARLGNTWLIRRRLPFLGKRQANHGDDYAAMLTALYQAAADHTGSRLLVDASKSPWHAAVAASLQGFDVSVLHLIRDPRGVAFSLRKKVDYQAGGQITMDRHGATASSLAWVYRNRLVESVWKNDLAYLQVRYEDFVADPEDQVARILDHTGLADVAVPFAGPNEIKISPSHNISGNPVRFQNGLTTLRADDKWRDALPQSTQKLVRLITWPHMRHFGYRG
ncbi:MAG: sulfotransferase [bacterium]|nr:sulfotransferase [bacterium]MCP4967348.1 sulfotransferase [bacterium]